jgi:hypothetical protein
MVSPKDLLSVNEIQDVREKARVAVAPLKPAKNAPYLYGKRTVAGQNLPAYYLVYFLLVELLDFPHSGQEEKVAWSIPVDLDGTLAFIEHRKLGLGIFSPPTSEDENVAGRIVALIEQAAKVARPFFNHLAARAVMHSHLNVTNNSDWLFERYKFVRDEFRKKMDEAKHRENEVNITENTNADGLIRSWTETYPAVRLREEAARFQR